MTDITIVIDIPDVIREVSRRSTLATQNDPFYTERSTEARQYSQLQEGRITDDFISEAAKEVLKVYLSRQGNVISPGFECNSPTNPDMIVYRFLENKNPLSTNQTASIKARLVDNTKDAIIYHVLGLLYKTDGNTPKAEIMLAKAMELTEVITGDIHRLHD